MTVILVRILLSNVTCEGTGLCIRTSTIERNSSAPTIMQLMGTTTPPIVLTAIKSGRRIPSSERNACGIPGICTVNKNG